MAIMAAQGQSDARGAAWLLADAALKSFDMEAGVEPNQIELNNAFRLMQIFVSNPVFGIDRAPLSVTSGSETLPIGAIGQGYVSEVRNAIDFALHSAFSGEESASAVREIQDTLRYLARPQTFARPHDDISLKVRSFFRDLQANLI